MNMNKKRIIIAAAVAAAAVATAAYLAMSGGGGHNMAVETAVVAEGDISNSVTATGTIEPVTSVDVGTQVSGIVANIYADYNSVVKKGQVIAELDKTNLISQVNTAKAALNNARSQLAYQRPTTTDTKPYMIRVLCVPTSMRRPCWPTAKRKTR